MARRIELTDEEARAATQVFALLLKGYERFGAEHPVNEPECVAELLDGFEKLTSDRRAITTSAEVEDLISGHLSAIEKDRVLQESRADDFNLLDVLQSTYKEIRHSMVLAWLLDSDLRKRGTHAQGALGFRLFLRELGLPESYADKRYWVRREVAGDEARVDIEIAGRGRFLIHIENKIHAGEGDRQTDREWSDLGRRATELGVLDPASIYALFLTPEGEPPYNADFKPISWRQIARVLEDFADQAKPPDVKLFAAHYARALRRFVVREEIEGDDHA